jgi:hypothetical protein
MGVLLTIGGNFPRLRAKLTHMVGHLPISAGLPFFQRDANLQGFGERSQMESGFSRL